MKIIVDKNAPTEIKNELSGLNPESGILSCGNVWVRADDDALLAIFVMNDKELVLNYQRLQSSIAEASLLTKYIYCCIVKINGGVSQHQLLAIQEMGVFTVVLDSLDRLNKFIEFVSDPKRRKDKKIPPSRNISIYTPGEQLLLCIPGIGAQKLSRLLRYFGRVAWVLAGMTQFDAVDSVAGITEEDVRNYRDMLGLEENEILLVEDASATQNLPAEPKPTVQPIVTEVTKDQQIKIVF